MGAAPNWYNAERVSQPGSVVLARHKADMEARRAAAAPAVTGPARRSFAAARVDRLTAGWLATQNSINNELRGDLDRLRARSRDLSKNNDYARKFKKMVTTNVVGPVGFKLQARVMNSATQADDLANATIEAGFADFARRGVCEVTGLMSFPDLCRAITGDVAIDGEFLVRKVRGKAARNIYGYALQHLDVDRLDTQLNQARTGSSNAIVMGIEIDAYRRPVAYHLFTSHPNDHVSGGRERERVPADDIIHGFIVEYAEQVRGAPWMSAAILTMHHLGEFEQSALLAARKGADTLGFFTSPDGLPPPVDGTDANDDPITVSVPGHYDTLPDGYDFKAYDSKYPDAMLADFTKSYLRRMASGLNVAYNGLANDLEGVNFSSIRSGVIDERDQWMTIQGWFIEAFLDIVYQDWMGLALLNSALTMPNGAPLPAAKRDKFLAHQWQGRRWQWVDPVKDINASLIAIRAGLTSPYAIASQMGLDLDDVMADLARANAAAAKAGLPSYAAAQIAAPEPKQATKPMVEEDDGTKALLLALARSMQQEHKAGDTIINNHPATVHVAPAEVRNEISVEPAEVPVIHVTNQIIEREQAAPVIHVAAPNVEVTVEATMPAQSEVTIVGLPDRQTTTEIVRDSKGDIKTSVQTEKDA